MQTLIKDILSDWNAMAGAQHLLTIARDAIDCQDRLHSIFVKNYENYNDCLEIQAT